MTLDSICKYLFFYHIFPHNKTSRGFMTPISSIHDKVGLKLETDFEEVGSPTLPDQSWFEA
jgi:hypothetical protein